MTPPPAAICVSELVKQFADAAAPALDRLSFRVAPGSITGLVGPDGAGKTTLLRLLAGLLHPTQGTLTVGGLDPAQADPRLHEWIGYMPQKFGLYEDLTVAENLQLYADLRQIVGTEREQRMARLLAFTDLGRFTDRYAGQLSGGMKQKLGLACTLLGQPRILLLDEPGVGVDPLSRRELWKMVRELAAQGMTVVWSTAYLDEAELCDSVLLLNQGRLLASGTPAELKAPLQGRCWYLAGFTVPRRPLLRQLLRRPEVIDGVIQGQMLRLVLTDTACCPPPAELNAGLHCHYLPAEPRQRFRHQATAAADIQHPPPRKGLHVIRCDTEMIEELRADITDPHRVQCMQWAHRPISIPPSIGERGKLRDFLQIDAGRGTGAGRAGGVHPKIPLDDGGTALGLAPVPEYV